MRKKQIGVNFLSLDLFNDTFKTALVVKGRMGE